MNEGKNKVSIQTQLKRKLTYFQSEAAKYKFLSEKYELLLSQILQSKQTEIIEPITEERLEYLSYFNYSIIQEKNNVPFIYGSFIIKNCGNGTLHSPIICLKATYPKSIIIGGKIGELENSSNNLVTTFEPWTFVHEDWREKWLEQGELWLKPQQTTKLQPGEKLTFSGFDLTFKEDLSGSSIIIEGFSYFQENKHGSKALNSISITL